VAALTTESPLATPEEAAAAESAAVADAVAAAVVAVVGVVRPRVARAPPLRSAATPRSLKRAPRRKLRSRANSKSPLPRCRKL
jgi:hypothetical protein